MNDRKTTSPLSGGNLPQHNRGEYDVVILTERRYVDPRKVDWYVRNLLKEDGMLMAAFGERGLSAGRINWDHPHFDWSSTKYIVFRSTWDYFHRYPEFSAWLDRTKDKTGMINPYPTIRWNLDKHYLLDLENRGIRIPPTEIVEPGEKGSLEERILRRGWTECILKPAISGGARHTYRLNRQTVPEHEEIFHTLLKTESMLIQEFQDSVISEGEAAFMVFGGKFSHAVLKRAKKGDFRVQDDFGGTVHNYRPSRAEVEFAEKAVSVCDPLPAYARVDLIRDHKGQICVSELELIEPELWFRNKPSSAVECAKACMRYMNQP
jgi:glutathione synthase/RimK-type ligase-like ATP-grasp enzyme